MFLILAKFLRELKQFAGKLLELLGGGYSCSQMKAELATLNIHTCLPTSSAHDLTSSWSMQATSTHTQSTPALISARTVLKAAAVEM
jgi:hypothetical protein